MNSGSMPQRAADTPADGSSAGQAGQAERLSAWLDGELDAPAADPVLAELLRRPDLQHRFQGWCMVSDALRSDEVLAGHSPRLCARISQALEHEPALLAPSALRPQLRRHLASGFAVVAAAVVLVLVAVPQLRGGSAPDSPALITSAGPADAGLATVAATPVARNPRLDPYFQAHHDFVSAGVMPAAAVYLRSGVEGER